MEVRLGRSPPRGMAYWPSLGSLDEPSCRLVHRRNIPAHLRLAVAVVRWHCGKFCSSSGYDPSASSINIRYRRVKSSIHRFSFDSLTRLAMTIGNRRSNHFLLKEGKKTKLN